MKKTPLKRCGEFTRLPSVRKNDARARDVSANIPENKKTGLLARTSKTIKTPGGAPPRGGPRMTRSIPHGRDSLPSHGLHRSTLGDGGLNCRVRNGTG